MQDYQPNEFEIAVFRDFLAANGLAGYGGGRPHFSVAVDHPAFSWTTINTTVTPIVAGLSPQNAPLKHIVGDFSFNVPEEGLMTVSAAEWQTVLDFILEIEGAMKDKRPSVDVRMPSSAVMDGMPTSYFTDDDVTKVTDFVKAANFAMRVDFGQRGRARVRVTVQEEDDNFIWNKSRPFGPLWVDHANKFDARQAPGGRWVLTPKTGQTADSYIEGLSRKVRRMPNVPVSSLGI